ncbi:hypothetical protein QEH68_07085 [Paenarthrobacter sp. OM7]|uniref:hypothetical protein n=1 Tax=Paenarthrobacter sp. OM7 TaxID=3041264 RepID=UPI0024687B6D|nr:hypothetical protein [Paenarthrobacter sp. OM7]WGM21932.1 hypothetical protein QEH68_07085 [Paenarthrobacter sp. OM7]
MATPSGISTPALYYSRVRATLIPRIAGFTMVALGPVLFVLIVLNNTPEVLFAPLVTTAAGSFIAFMTVTVKVDSQNIVIAFCDIFKRTLPKDEIATLTTDNAAGPSGYGFRYMGPGMVGYLVGGPEINIEMKSGKTVIASTDRPEQLIRVLAPPQGTPWSRLR